MTTPLHSALKRALTIEGREFVVTLTSEGLKLTLKGKRKGFELAWAEIVNGEAALAVALHASLRAFPTSVRAEPTKPGASTRVKTKRKLPKRKQPSAPNHR